MFQPLSLAFLACSFFTGLGFAFMFPLMSLYLIDGIGATPLQMGVYLAIQVASGVLVSTWLGKRSDEGWSRKRILTVSQLCFVAAMLVFMATRNYFVALSASVFLLSVGAATLPQMFTLGRLYSDKQLGSQGDLFMSVLRAAIAVAWVAGPPLAFFLKASYGQSAAFSAAILSALIMLLIVRLLPEYSAASDAETVKQSESAELAEPVSQAGQATEQLAWYRMPSLMLYLLACLFMFSAGTMYNATIPLYLSKELLLDAQWAGYLMGLAALLEVPFMLLAGLLGPKFGYRRSIAVGLVAGALFYSGLLLFSDITMLLVLQLLNGVFIAIISTLGMILAQNMMRHAMGLATTLFTNALQLASLMGSLLIGVIAQWANYYSVFIGCLTLVTLALLFLALSGMKTSRLEAETESEKAGEPAVAAG